MATALAELHARGLNLASAELPAVHSLWQRTGVNPLISAGGG